MVLAGLRGTLATELQSGVLKHKGAPAASRNKFRTYSDVTQRLVTMWQICSGNFAPHKYQGKMFLVDESNYREAAAAIRNQEYPIVSLNETGEGELAETRNDP